MPPPGCPSAGRGSAISTSSMSLRTGSGGQRKVQQTGMGASRMFRSRISYTTSSACAAARILVCNIVPLTFFLPGMFVVTFGFAMRQNARQKWVAPAGSDGMCGMAASRWCLWSATHSIATSCPVRGHASNSYAWAVYALNFHASVASSCSRFTSNAGILARCGLHSLHLHIRRPCTHSV